MDIGNDRPDAPTRPAANLRLVPRFLRTTALAVFLASLCQGCATLVPTADPARYAPLIGFEPAALGNVPANELERLRLVALDLVATLAQLPALHPAAATLQITRPGTPFGVVVVRALEDAGYGLQLVGADQGLRHVRYSERHAMTESGPVDDYTLEIGEAMLRRAYAVRESRIFPSSLLSVSGADGSAVELNEAMFREQGGTGATFVSGIRTDDAHAGDRVDVVEVTAADEVASARRLPARVILAEARARGHAADAARSSPDPPGHRRVAREVLVFEGGTTDRMGMPNKLLLARIADTREARDVLVIRGCHDTDGRDPLSLARSIRVREELLGRGVSAGAVRIAPCVRAGYRRAAANTDAAVELLQLRPADGSTSR